MLIVLLDSKFVKKSFLLIILFLFTSLLAVENYYVSTTGDDWSGNGTAGNPWQTINHAVEWVPNTTTTEIIIHIAAGTYNLWDGDETNGIEFDADFMDITLQGADEATTIVEGHESQNLGNGTIFYILQDENVTINDMTIRNGAISGDDGGAFEVLSGSSLTMNNCSILDNLSAHVDEWGGGFGGGILMAESTTLTMTDCTISGNLANYGGGIYALHSTLDLTGCLFDDNQAFGGGAIGTDRGTETTGGTVTLTNCILRNHADGGAIEPNYATLNMTNCTVHDNVDDGEGGGIDGYESTIVITNSTICNNTSGDSGGGIYYNSNSTLTITNSTVANNTCDPSRNGGGIYQSGGAIHIKNTILANNTGMSGTRNDFYISSGSKNDNGYNIVEASNQTFNAAGDITGNQINLNLSSNLADNYTTNGTQTLALTTNSVAIDGGDASSANNGVAIPANDQRGTNRNGTIDIGSYEYWGNGGANPNNPNAEATNHILDFAGVLTSDIDLTWTENDGAQVPCGYLIIGSEGTITDPVDGTDVADETDLRGDPGYGVVHVAHGKSSYSFSFFDELSEYNFKIYSYTNSGTIINYKLNGTVPSIVVATYDVDPEPTNHVTSFHADPYDAWEIDCYWNDNDGAQAADGFLIVASTGVVTIPTDGVDPADDTDLTDGSGNKKVLHENDPYYFQNCSSETTYNFKIFPYTNSGNFIDFKTDGVVPSDDATTPEAPVEPTEGDLIITEIVGNAVHEEFMSGYLEIYNTTLNILDLRSVEVQYYDNHALNPSAVAWLSGTLAVDSYAIIAQNMGQFQTIYGFPPDFEANMFPFDGGEDSIELHVASDRAGAIDQFNDPADPWSWAGDEPLERTSTSNGGSSSSWTENTGGSGSPGTSNDNPLPIVLSTFYSAVENSVPTLFWTTMLETENLGWNVYRSDSDNLNQSSIQNDELIEGTGTTTFLTDYSFTDPYPVLGGANYWYWLESISFSGETELFGPVTVTIPNGGNQPDIPPVPEHYGLYQNYPNPFNPSTTISFDVMEDEKAELSIYNLKGQILLKESFEEGKHHFNWEPQDQSSGIYFYTLESKSYSEIRKMILLR